jgi:hypothetical protein
MNQCDGCRRGLPVENGVHRGPGGFWAGDVQACTKDRYETHCERCTDEDPFTCEIGNPCQCTCHK